MVTVEFDMCRLDRDFVDYSWGSPVDLVALAKRNAYIKECRLFLFSILGAIVRQGQLLFWQIKKVITMRGRLKGFVFFYRRLSNSRGLHKSRSIHSGRRY